MKCLISTYVINQKERSLVVNVKGRLCSHNAIRFKKEIFRHIHNIYTDVTIDVTKLNQIDFSGINSLALACKEAGKLSASIQLIVGDKTPAMKELKQTKFHRVLPMEVIH